MDVVDGVEYGGVNFFADIEVPQIGTGEVPAGVTLAFGIEGFFICFVSLILDGYLPPGCKQ